MASSSWGFGRVPQWFMGTEYKAYDWHLLPWMGYQLSLFSLSLSLLLLLCCYSWLVLKHPQPGCWGITQVWESESQGGVSGVHDLEKVTLFFKASGSTVLYHYRKSIPPAPTLWETPELRLMESVGPDSGGGSPGLQPTVHSEIHFPHSA